MKPLEGKKVLFIGIGFYDYETQIVRKIEKAGAEVIYYHDQPKVLRTRLIRTIATKLVSPATIHAKYQRSILKEVSQTQIDYVLVIKGEYLQEWFVKGLRANCSSARFVMYQWDSLTRVPQAVSLMKYFDRVLSFDRQDCLTHPDLVFRPLFYRELSGESIEKPKYDLIFIGLLHADRAAILKNIIQACRSMEKSYFVYVKSSLRDWLLSKRSEMSGMTGLFALPYDRVQHLVHCAKVVLDLHHPLQTGLTMRTIETLGQKKKLITTNPDVRNYDFFDPDNICIVDRGVTELDASFFQTPYKELPSNVRNKYSLEAWICDVFLIDPPSGSVPG